MIRATLLALTGAALMTGSALADNPKDKWLGSFDEVLAAAKKENKPVFLVFR